MEMLFILCTFYEVNMNVKKKSSNSFLWIALLAILVLAFIGNSCFRDRDKAADDNSAYGTVEYIEKTAAGAAGDIADAAGRNNTAQNAISRADTELESSQRAATESADRIDRIQSLINECIRRNQESINLMQRIEGSTAAGEK